MPKRPTRRSARAFDASGAELFDGDLRALAVAYRRLEIVVPNDARAERENTTGTRDPSLPIRQRAVELQRRMRDTVALLIDEADREVADERLYRLRLTDLGLASSPRDDRFAPCPWCRRQRSLIVTWDDDRYRGGVRWLAKCVNATCRDDTGSRPTWVGNFQFGVLRDQVASALSVEGEGA